MNYLGHLLLTYPDTELTMGNLLGDMLRAKEVRHLPEGHQTGVAMHHFIDRFTDTHTGIRELVTLVRPRHGKYAPVVIDILLDHVLAVQWEVHAPIPYQNFTQWVYTEVVPLETERIDHPVRERIRNMAAHGWLDGYPSREGMLYVLARMDSRTSFPSLFTEALHDFDHHGQLFHRIFEEFYQQLRDAIASEFDR